MTFAAQWIPARAAVAQWALTGNKPGRDDVHLTTPSASIGEQQDAPFYARIYNKLNVLIKQSDVYQLVVRVYDRDGIEVYGSEEDPTTVVFDTLQTGEPWTADATGYNFRFVVPGLGVFTAGGRSYACEFVLELLDGDTITVSGTLRVRPNLANVANTTQ